MLIEWSPWLALVCYLVALTLAKQHITPQRPWMPRALPLAWRQRILSCSSIAHRRQLRQSAPCAPVRRAVRS